MLEVQFLTDVVLMITALSGFGTAIILSIRNGKKVSEVGEKVAEVHVLVNSEFAVMQAKLLAVVTALDEARTAKALSLPTIAVAAVPARDETALILPLLSKLAQQVLDETHANTHTAGSKALTAENQRIDEAIEKENKLIDNAAAQANKKKPTSSITSPEEFN